MSAAILTVLALAGAPFDDAARDDGVTPLPEIVVTATRIEAETALTPGARVVTRDTIEQRGAVFAADILADVPGLSVVRTGAFGGVAQVRMRGAGVGKTLVLIDGVPVNDPADISGAYDFAGLDLSGVERIEVLSGPQSSLWGSDAIGGVIAFTTRETDGLEALAEAGSFDTLRGRLAVGMAEQSHAFSAWVSRFDTRGISAADEADGATERDSFENTSIGARGRIEFSPAAGLDAGIRWSRGDAEIDSFPAPDFALADTDDSQHSEQWSAYGRFRLNALGLDHQFSLSASDIERETRSDFPSVFNADRQVWRWQADGQAGVADFAFGAEREDTSGSLSSGLSEDLGTTSVFALAKGKVTPGLTLSGALRWDDTDDFGSETTGRVSAAYELGSGLILSGAYGTGFKAPSISQAVCDFCFSAEPFPVLRPERAEGTEVAIGWQSPDGRLSGRATLYRLEVEDQIDYVNGVYANIDQTRTDGIELEGRADLGSGFALSAAYAWTDAVDESDGSRLLRVSEHSGSATLGWSDARFSAALTVRAEGDQDDAGGVRDGFVTANLNGAWRLNESVELTARIENLADKHYQQVLGYGKPGRSGYVGIRLRY